MDIKDIKPNAKEYEMILTYSQSKKDNLKQEGFYSLSLQPMLAELRLGKSFFMPTKK